MTTQKKKFGRWKRWHWKHVPAVIKKREGEKKGCKEEKERCPWPWFRNQKGKSIVNIWMNFTSTLAKGYSISRPMWAKKEKKNYNTPTNGKGGDCFFACEWLSKIRSNSFHPRLVHFFPFGIFHRSENFVCFAEKVVSGLFPLVRRRMNGFEFE